MERLKTISVGLCVAVILAPSLLVCAHVEFAFMRLPVGLIDTAIICTLLTFCVERNRSWWVRGIVGLMALGCATCCFLLAWFAIDTTMVVPAIGLVVLAPAFYATHNLPGRTTIWVAAMLALGVVAKLILITNGWLQHAPDPLVGTGEPLAQQTYVEKEFWSPERRYALVYGQNEKVANFLPHTNRTFVWDFSLDEPQQEVHEGGYMRTALIDDRYIAVTRMRAGVFLLDRRDLVTATPVHTEDPQAFNYMGVVYDRKRQELIALKSDGELFFFSYPGLELRRTVRLPVETQSFLDEQFNDLFLFQDRYLVATEQLYGLVGIDLETNSFLGRIATPGITANLVSPDQGQTMIYAAYGSPIVQRRRTHDLALLSEFSVCRGCRYMALLPDNEHVAVADYTTGQVTVLSLDGQTRIGPFQTGMRVQWLSVSPDQSLLDVVHSQGVTRLRIDALLTQPEVSSPSATYPLWILRPAVIYQIVSDSLRSPLNVVINWILAFLCGFFLIRPHMSRAV